MYILTVNDKLDPVGGAEQDLIDEAEGLEKRGHRIELVTEDKINLDKISENKPDLISIHNLFNPSVYSDLLSISKCIHYVHDHRTYSIGSSRLHFRSNEICDSQLNLTHTLVASYTQGCGTRNPLVVTKLFFQRKTLLDLHNHLSMVIANSEYVKSNLVKNGVRKDLVRVVYPSVNLPKSTKGVKSEKPIILFAGRLFIEKGVEYLIRAMQYVDGGQAWIAGSGWDENRLKSLVEELHLRDKVKFLGFIKPQEIASLYKACTVGVVPSIWPEPFGLSGTNFMSFGKPVVGFDSGGIKEWLRDNETGFLVKRLDTKSLAEKINVLLKDKALREKFGKKSKQIYEEEFSMKIHLDKIEKLFEEVVRQ